MTAGYQPGGGHPQPPPSTPPLAAEPDRPAAMRAAVWLMCAGAAAILVTSVAVGLYLHSEITKRIGLEASAGQAGLDTGAEFITGMMIVFGVIMAGLWLWMAWKNGTGRNWARILATVFFGLSCLTLRGDLAGTGVGGLYGTWDGSPIRLPAAFMVLGLAYWAIGLAAVVLIWQQTCTRYCQARKALRTHGQVPQYGIPGDGHAPPPSEPPG